MLGDLVDQGPCSGLGLVKLAGVDQSYDRVRLVDEGVVLELDLSACRARFADPTRVVLLGLSTRQRFILDNAARGELRRAIRRFAAALIFFAALASTGVVSSELCHAS